MECFFKTEGRTFKWSANLTFLKKLGYFVKETFECKIKNLLTELKELQLAGILNDSLTVEKNDDQRKISLWTNKKYLPRVY